MDLADRMRLQNQEQFHTLVRMHLSFELDLNTDDNEVVLNEKVKFRKRFNFHKRPKSCTSSKSGSPACNSARTLTADGIAQLRQLMEFLMEEQNVIQEGIFRRTGSVARQNELKSRINEGTPLCLKSGIYSVHDCASVLKGILAELPEPLLTDAYCPAHLQMAELCNNMDKSENKAMRLLHSLQLLILLLPQENRTLLREVTEMLNQTIKYEKSNKMSADSLATLFTPHLICPKKLTPEALHSSAQNMSGVISFMITKGSAIFEIPLKLATDIRAYFVEQKRKETMSPEHILNESVTSDSTANTVYTFIDRERTAQAHVQNPTDTCLAQLYAYIQSLPESSKKRKLIKQFNKENGQGTPLQLQMLHRLKNPPSATKSNSKSLGDSIKRHIFQKNLISKTPKHQLPGTPSSSTLGSPVVFNTPNRRSSTNRKTRLLFQSPFCPTTQKFSLASSNSATKASATVAVNPASMNHFDGTPSYTNLKSATVQPLSTPPSRLNCSGSSHDEPRCSKDVDTPEYELLSDTIAQLQNSVTAPSCKKSVGFLTLPNLSDDEHFHTPSLIDDNSLSNCDLKSRFKSEPNLSSILTEHNINSSGDIDINGSCGGGGGGHNFSGRYIANKLLKGVSMVNLMLPMSDSPLRNTCAIKRNISIENLCKLSTPPRRRGPEPSDDNDVIEEDIDDPDFEATPSSHSSFSFSNKTDFLMVTPTAAPDFLARRSMSPITKSTQRMSKAMQESIMTPRSRKPVMLPGALLSSSNQSTHLQSSFSSLREEDEDISEEFNFAEMPDRVAAHSLYRSKSEGDFNELLDDRDSRLMSASKILSEGSKLSVVPPVDSLTSPFRNYLFARSVASTSPVDSSFSSQPDDFGSTQDIQHMTESELSESLLYCLNGNRPSDLSTTSMDTASRISYMQSCSTSRKRGNEDIDSQVYFDEVHPKKMIVVEMPGETSL